ncbi:MAG: hypothetical protein N3E45_05880 [Oscillatoriaceae bacterium SKW80]|nr:hypothetical protein [Oscillatoriaceae bacterium SKYG93]MCX8120343.1 hypothetical protein [Oscillatoriaceae bacterium SKW80]MDW8453269.1 hypothetical protein [Oscillatoriaceae cyanobacterium SKYGB_i_bin93]HIK27288.1 hypothetical protein [Oscillatoriaceae cyanobacterium M7585_C2015_266]
MFRKLITLLMVFTLCWSAVACGSNTADIQQSERTTISSGKATKIADGQYPVQQAIYDEASGEYSLFLLNASPGVYRTTDLQMARLSDEEIQAGKKAYLKVENGKSVLYLSEDFKIEYVHTVTETRPAPQTGEPKTVIVRQESSFWAPFAGALAGEALGSFLFTPRYYLPPIYQPGITLTGYGGYGSTYDEAIERYQARYQAPPPLVRRPQMRTSGRINQPASDRPLARPSTGNKPTGSGFGSSTLKQSDYSRPSRVQPGSGSFGSGRSGRSFSGSRSGGFGSRRR